MYQTVNYVTGIKCKLCSRKYKTTGARRAPVVFGGRGLEMRIRRRRRPGSTAQATRGRQLGRGRQCDRGSATARPYQTMGRTVLRGGQTEILLTLSAGSK